jgi:hypothetical protein
LVPASGEPSSFIDANPSVAKTLGSQCSLSIFICQAENEASLGFFFEMGDRRCSLEEIDSSLATCHRSPGWAMTVLCKGLRTPEGAVQTPYVSERADTGLDSIPAASTKKVSNPSAITSGRRTVPRLEDSLGTFF